MELKRQLGLVAATFVIIADMIGTGIFMTTGTILGMTKSAPLVLALWVTGGLVAVSGALCYAELATIWPEAGGEYAYIRNIYGRIPAFLTGWISLAVGFSAPVAVSSLLLVQYVNRSLHTLAGTVPSNTILDTLWVQKLCAAALIIFFGAMHIIGVKRGSALQNWLTAIKILLLVLLIAFGLYRADWSMTHRLAAHYGPSSGTAQVPLLQAGLVLLIIMYAYSGWNSASYLGGEIREPARNLPRALLCGTFITAGLYVLLNVVFLISADGALLMGKEEIGAVASTFLFGPGASAAFAMGIAVVLLSSVSAQMMVGPRVIYAMAKDDMIFRSLAGVHPRFETPFLAILVQMLLAVLYVFAGNALTLVIYMGFALSIFPFLTVVGLLRLRRTRQELHAPYRVPFYPVLPLLYISLTAAMMIAALVTWTETSCIALAVLLAGIPAFHVWQRLAPHSRPLRRTGAAGEARHERP